MVLALLLVTGCGTPLPIPAATATRTPVVPTPTPTLTPTMTPTSTPTRTPTPTPTLPLNLVLQPVPEAVSTWFPLPADLFFLHNGRINIWLAEGAHIEVPLLAEDNKESVHSYVVTPDGRFITYITTSGKLYRLDRATWEHTLLPTSGYLVKQNAPYFMMTDDGNHIYYTAWGTQPSTASSPQSSAASGTILGINALQPRALQNVIGYGEGIGDIPCLDFKLSPDERHIAYLDGHGGWLSTIDGNAPLFLAPHGDTLLTDILWSNDGRGLLLSGDTAQALWIDISANEPLTQVIQLCNMPCVITEKRWSANNLWLIVTDAQSCLVEVDVETIANNQPDLLNRICQMDGWDLKPTSLYTLLDNRIIFMHGGCGAQCAGPTAGLYMFNQDKTIYPLALTEAGDSTTYWTPDGSTFLNVSRTNPTRTVGLLNTPAYWDVTVLLRDSTSFVWGQPSLPNQ
ncbi:MAG: hypothetical protein E4H27_00730 [Anaerolineales bacterium]|nr:MAG: hypothetical protein E4H27_00730 [Anaerolineales bacterium]